MKRPASPSDDIYAFGGQLLFHVVFEKEPFQYSGTQAKERGLNWEEVSMAGRWPTLAALLNDLTATGTAGGQEHYLKPLFILLGIDQLMDMARTSVNVLGNCLATVVVARWEGDFGKEQPSPVVMNAVTG